MVQWWRSAHERIYPIKSTKNSKRKVFFVGSTTVYNYAVSGMVNDL